MTIIGVIASSITGGLGGAGTYESIATATANGTSNTITFTSIPQTYAHLEVRALARTSATGNFGTAQVNLRINNDSASVYNAQELYGNGTGVNAFAAAQGLVMEVPGTTFGANLFSYAIMDILDYTSTNKAKTIRTTFGGVDMSNNGYAAQTSMFYSATPAAITRLDFILNTGNFIVGSQFALYGIKAA